MVLLSTSAAWFLAMLVLVPAALGLVLLGVVAVSGVSRNRSRRISSGLTLRQYYGHTALSH